MTDRKSDDFLTLIAIGLSRGLVPPEEAHPTQRKPLRTEAGERKLALPSGKLRALWLRAISLLRRAPSPRASRR